ncbi:TIGR02186 family protein [Pseudochrobactrum sp. HB0163]|uniref:TIGR02186 family protein n=1 Tax=Pseudochrobactrum sp. HB0163 TaxID=3450708 RepID=UPI003F6DCF3C
MRHSLNKTIILLGIVVFALSAQAGIAAPRKERGYELANIKNIQEPLPLPETIEIGLSTETIAIASNFSGTNLTIFGALDNADPLIRRQGRYDIIVVLEGPQRNLVVREKSRYLGIWVNADSETFLSVPLSYSLASTRPLQDITDERTYRQLSLGVNYFALNPEYGTLNYPNAARFGQELREIKSHQGLYTQKVGAVEFVSQTLFRATLSLSANVPVGRHKARALLFRHGVFIGEANTHLNIVKAGFEQRIYEAAHQYSLAYGLFAVFLAGLTGWLGQLLFRND